MARSSMRLDGATFDSLSPATGRSSREIAACGEADVDRAVARRPGRVRPRRLEPRSRPAERKAVLLHFADLIESHLRRAGRHRGHRCREADHRLPDFDLPDVLNTIRWYAEAIDKVFGKISPTGRPHLA